MESAVQPHEFDRALADVYDAVRTLAGSDPEAFFGQIIRRSIDEVLDGPRTGRWDFDQLEKTEKTYVGTKIEIVFRAALALGRGRRLDLEIGGHDVDLKWAMNSSWQIPHEAVNELCLCIGGLRSMSQFQVGVVRCSEAHLNQGENRDRKRTLSAAGREAMRLLVPPVPLPTNFVAEMDPGVRAKVITEETIQGRVTKLFRLLPRTPIPRGAVQTIARTEGDPMRRLRADSWAGDPLKGMRILSSQYGNAVVKALGMPPLAKGEFMSVPQAEIDGLPDQVKRGLPKTVRERFGFD